MALPSGPPPVRLVRRAMSPAQPPLLDPVQREVVDHRGGPLLVLAGPGTGKTTTLVEAVRDRVDRDGLAPDEVLVLTFSRRAAAELRQRISARLGRTVREPLARTFHSYAFGLLRREAVLHGEPAPGLLSGPEQDKLVRDLLAGDRAGEGTVTWPATLDAALPTRGFARELRDLLARAAERDISPAELARLGRVNERPEWVAAAAFARQYEQVTNLRSPPAYDPAGLVRAAVALLEADRRLAEQERAAYALVVVDEYQDSDPLQERLLHLLAGNGRDLVVVGDPDQSIYAFRGAEVAGIEKFTERFRNADGSPARQVALTVSRRCGPALLAASRRVAARMRYAGHRDLVPADGLADGSVEVALLRSNAQEGAHVAQVLRRAHRAEGVPWSRMAVLVRGGHALPPLRRALQTAGVPTTIRLEEMPLAQQPPVRALLDVVEVSGARRALDPDVAADLLTGPLGGADALALRRLRQALRRHERDHGGGRSSGALLVEALLDPAELAMLDDHVTAAARRVAGIIAAARSAWSADGCTAEDVLWAAWDASGCARTWARQALGAGARGAAADRDLDAVVALFDAAARFVDRLPGAGTGPFLDHVRDQQIPGDTLAVGATTPDAVTVMTAHAAKGLEFDVVAVAGVQEGVWPDLRQRGSVLGAPLLVELAAGEETGTPQRVSALLAEERRLFYVAITRARRRLVVTAVAEEGAQARPSRFLDEIDPTLADTGAAVPVRTAGLDRAGMVGELRGAVCDPAAPADVRAAAARHLARLAAAGVRGAHPDDWYALGPVSDPAALRDPDEPVRVSPSKVEAFTRCALKWLLETAGGTAQNTVSQGVGSLLHDLAQRAATDGLDDDAVRERFERDWPAVDAGAGWAARREHARAADMLERLLTWLRSDDRTLVAAEEPFEVAVGRAVVVGRVDRLVADPDGRVGVDDLKTSKTRPGKADLPRHPQLGVYQMAVEAGGFAQVGPRESAGGRLVMLAHPHQATGATAYTQEPLGADPDPQWASRLVADTAEGMAGADFPAQVGDWCRMCPVKRCCPAHPEGAQVTT